MRHPTTHKTQKKLITLFILLILAALLAYDIIVNDADPIKSFKEGIDEVYERFRK